MYFCKMWTEVTTKTFRKFGGTTFPIVYKFRLLFMKVFLSIYLQKRTNEENTRKSEIHVLSYWFYKLSECHHMIGFPLKQGELICLRCPLFELQSFWTNICPFFSSSLASISCLAVHTYTNWNNWTKNAYNKIGNNYLGVLGRETE